MGFLKEYSESNRKSGLKCSNEIEDKIPNQRKIYYLKKDKLLRKHIDRNISFREIFRTYVELENRLKALEEVADNKSF